MGPKRRVDASAAAADVDCEPTHDGKCNPTSLKKEKPLHFKPLQKKYSKGIPKDHKMQEIFLTEQPLIFGVFSQIVSGCVI